MNQRILEKTAVYKSARTLRQAAGILPESLDMAAGLLKKKYKGLTRHYRRLREEWPAYAAK